MVYKRELQNEKTLSR